MIVNGRLLPSTMHIHNQMQILNVPTALLTYTILLIAYCLAGSVRRAQYIYEAIKLVGACIYHVIPYRSIIKVSVAATMWHFAWDIKEETVSAGVHPTAVTWFSLVRDFPTEDLEECEINTVDKVFLLGYEPPWNRYNTSTTDNPVHDVASSYRTGTATNVHVRLALGYTSVLISDADMHFRTTKAMGCMDGCIQGAMTLFGLISNKCTIPEIVIYMAVVDGCCKALQFADGQGVFWPMQTIDISSNAFSTTVFVQRLCKGQQQGEVIRFCLAMLEAGHSPFVTTYIGLVETRSEEALCVIPSMSENGQRAGAQAHRLVGLSVWTLVAAVVPLQQWVHEFQISVAVVFLGSKVMFRASHVLHQGEGPITREVSASSNMRRTTDNRTVQAKTEMPIQKTRLARWKATGVVALSGCCLKVVPEEVWMCGPSVRVLDISNNSIQEFNAKIGLLVSVQKLLLNANEILDGSICWEGFPSMKFLTVLSLAYNHLTTFPAALGALSSLQQLHISNNKLTGLPDEMGLLSQLQILKANNNRISSLPSSMRNCGALVEVEFTSNHLVELPQTFGSLSNLKTLVLGNNALKSLPPTLLKMCSLLSTLALHPTEITNDHLRQFEGWDVFYERRLDFRVGFAFGMLRGHSLLDSWTAGFSADDGVDEQVYSGLPRVIQLLHRSSELQDSCGLDISTGAAILPIEVVAALLAEYGSCDLANGGAALKGCVTPAHA